jgi:hypothetical protein
VFYQENGDEVRTQQLKAYIAKGYGYSALLLGVLLSFIYTSPGKLAG